MKMAGKQAVEVDENAANKAKDELADAWNALETAMYEHCADLALLSSAGALKRLRVRAMTHELDELREYLMTPMDDEW